MAATPVRLPFPPVGVKIYPRDAQLPALGEVFTGVSYCEAVGRALAGGVVRVEPDSIGTCKWSRVVLGLRAPETDFERGLAPALPPTAALLLAPLARFPEGLEPDVVLLRGPLPTLARLFAAVGPEETARELAAPGRVDASALALLGHGRDSAANRAARRLLAALRRRPAWKGLTAFLFRSHLVTRLFDRAIRGFMADMSVCRNSTVVPFLVGKANLSFFCAGGITWGGGRADHLTSGWPRALYRRIEGMIETG